MLVRSARGAATLLAALALLTAAPARAEVPLLTGFGGTADYGTDCLGPNDDGSSMVIDLTPIFPEGLRFFGEVHTEMYVNTNGNVTFSGALPEYTPEAFPVADRPMIAPYWGDVDIREQQGSRMCRGTAGCADTSCTAPACHNPTENGIWWYLDTANERVVVTWDRVGYYACSQEKRMSFQLVLTRSSELSACGGGGDFDVEFRFNQCEWNTGSASGGRDGLRLDDTPCVVTNPLLGLQCPVGGEDRTCDSTTGTCGPGVAAQSGFDAGNRENFVEIMDSRTNSIHTTLCNESNVGMAGLWQFEIRAGVVVCPDAGTACDTGLAGACADGQTACVGGGTECVPIVPTNDESCDALDNDCDGTVDEGDALCPVGEACMEGVCIGNCFEGGCPPGLLCSDSGLCVEEGCEDVECPDGERCEGGECVGACDGITCPAGLVCRAARCVDLCAGDLCDDCSVCVDGECPERCETAGCPDGEACQGDGRCVPDACDGVDCAAGEYCDAGSCVDTCADAVCPPGEVCETGVCVTFVPEPEPDAGVPDAGPGPSSPDAGPPPPLDAGFDAGVEMDAGREPGRSADGCGCRVPGSAPSSPAGGAFGLLLLGLALVWRRRR